MSWSKTADLLRRHLNDYRKKFDAGEDLAGLPWFRAMHAREEKYRHQIDQLCQKFIFSREWPRMNKIQGHLVSYRLAWAVKMSLGLETAFVASGNSKVLFPQDLDEAQILHWLLIDTWSLAPALESKDLMVDTVIHALASEQAPPKRSG